MCLFNINCGYMVLWEEWSKGSKKYEPGKCEELWSKFKKNKDGLKIGSLLLWAKEDNEDKYEEFIKDRKLGTIVKDKYPIENFILGNRQVVTDKISYIDIMNNNCLIKGGNHDGLNNSMYIDICDKIMTVKCKHPECFGKIYPCNHTITLNKNEMNMVFNGDINITINKEDDELVDFQEIDIYETPKLNELVYNGLSGKSTQYAEIIYNFYENDYMYAEDDNWYSYKNHRWNFIGKKNTELRYNLHPKLKKIYSQLYSYCKENKFEKQQIKLVKSLLAGLGDTNMKNNIMTELIDIFV